MDPGPGRVSLFVLGVVAAWDSHLTGLIAERTRRFEPVQLRPVPIELLVMEQMDIL